MFYQAHRAARGRGLRCPQGLVLIAALLISPPIETAWPEPLTNAGDPRSAAAGSSEDAGGPSQSLPDPTAEGLPPVRGGWGPPPVEPPPESGWEQATLGADQLHEAIGRIGDGDLAAAVEGLRPLAMGDKEAGHQQEARFYLGIAKQEAGLPLLAARSFAVCLRGADRTLSAEALVRMQRLERSLPGMVLLLDLPEQGPGPAPPLPPELRARVDLADAVDLVRSGKPEQAVALLGSIPRESPVQGRARLVQASLLWEDDPEQALSVLLPPGEERLLPKDVVPETSLLVAAWLVYGQGDLERARSLFSRVRAPSRLHQEAVVGAAWSSMRLGQPAEALRMLLALGSGEGTDLPAGGYALAALIYLEACELQRAEALLDLSDRKLSADLGRLDKAVEGPADALRDALADPPDDDLASLLLLPDDERLEALLHAVRSERQSLSAIPGPRGEGPRSPLAVSTYAPELAAELGRMEELLLERAELGLGRRARQERSAVMRWLRLVLALRHEVLERLKAGVRDDLAAGRESVLPSGKVSGAWSFQPGRWIDPAAASGDLEHGSCQIEAGSGD